MSRSRKPEPPIESRRRVLDASPAAIAFVELLVRVGRPATEKAAS